MVNFPSRFDVADNPWLRSPGVVRIMDAVAAGGGEARFVGGCVRDALQGLAVGEMDLAVNLEPNRVSELLKREGMKVVPTGIDHGTVTAVVDGRAFEITSLRRDVETYGRRAIVDYTDDWQEDASRRDFTINALYADRDGNIYDYFGGREDLAAGRVRFIGDARARIKEDVLRILRFFRMIANMGGKNVEIDQESLSACSELARLIPNLSIERVWSEIKKMLVSPGVLRGWELMEQSGVLAHFLPEAKNVGVLQKLISVEGEYAEPSAMRRLASLVFSFDADQSALADDLKLRFRLSNLESKELRLYATLPMKLRGKLDPVPLRRFVYENGADPTRDAALLLAAVDRVDLGEILDVIARWVPPQFPVKGEDLINLGIFSGPGMGNILKVVEEWWKDADFRPTRQECLNRAKEVIR